MTVTSVVIRQRVDDLDAALPFYEALTGASASRFSFGVADLASVGPFLLFAAAGDEGDRLARVAGTLVTDDLDAQLVTVAATGADVIAAPASTPSGRRAVVRHPDGSVYEYVGR